MLGIHATGILADLVGGAASSAEVAEDEEPVQRTDPAPHEGLNVVDEEIGGAAEEFCDHGGGEGGIPGLDVAFDEDYGGLWVRK